MRFRHILWRSGFGRPIDLELSSMHLGGEPTSHRHFPVSLMSESNVATPADPVYLVWSVLREQGFDAAQQCAVALAHDGVTPQIHADLCASAGHFEQAYHSASLGQGESSSGSRYARLALFADAQGKQDVAKHYSDLAVTAQPETMTTEWILWLIDDCRAYAAAAHLLRHTRVARRKMGAHRGGWPSPSRQCQGRRLRLSDAKHWRARTCSIRRFIRSCRCIWYWHIARFATGTRLSECAAMCSRSIPLTPKWRGN
jgi:hypothetical protein